MEKAYKEYTRWCRQRLPEDLAAELCVICGDENEIYNRFCKDISFGTSGLRAKMGAGSNRINSVTLRKASIGISRYLNEKGTKPELVIGFDTRNNSKEYAEIVAHEFADTVWMFISSESRRPSPWFRLRSEPWAFPAEL